MPENFLPYCKLFITLQKSVAAIHSAMGAIKDNEMDGYHNPAYYPLLKMAGISQNAWFDMQKIKKEQSQS